MTTLWRLLRQRSPARPSWPGVRRGHPEPLRRRRTWLRRPRPSGRSFPWRPRLPPLRRSPLAPLLRSVGRRQLARSRRPLRSHLLRSPQKRLHLLGMGRPRRGRDLLTWSSHVGPRSLGKLPYLLLFFFTSSRLLRLLPAGWIRILPCLLRRRPSLAAPTTLARLLRRVTGLRRSTILPLSPPSPRASRWSGYRAKKP
jgi:hypothetical protein